jgi:hypothetical protein
MLLRIQHYDFQLEEFAEVSRNEAVRLFQQTDWWSELARFEEARRRGYQPCNVGMELTDDSGSRLFIGPVDRQSVCFNYIYPRFHSEFGLCQIEREEERFVASYPIEAVSRLIALHYKSERGAILQIESEEIRTGLTWREDGTGSGRP